MTTEEFLAHYGTKNMKWGQRNYQNYDGSLTSEGRRHYGIGPPRGSKEALKKKAQEEKATRRSEKKAERQARKAERSKKVTMEYLRDHPKQIYRHRKELDEADVRKLVSQIEFDRKLKDIRDSEVQRGWAKVKRFSDNVNTVSSLLDSGKKIANIALDVNNALYDNGVGDRKRYRKLGDKAKDDKDNKDD